MGRKISASDFPASAQIKVAGAEIKGVFEGGREAPTKFGPKPVFRLKVLDAKCEFLKDDEVYEPAAGESVEIWAPTLLARQLGKVKLGQTVTIKYIGLGEKSGSGNAPHMHDVEVE